MNWAKNISDNNRRRNSAAIVECCISDCPTRRVKKLIYFSSAEYCETAVSHVIMGNPIGQYINCSRHTHGL